MARFGDAASVVLADQDLAIAKAAAERVNALLNTQVARAMQLDVCDRGALVALLRSVDAFLSAVPYFFNLDITQAAVEAQASMCDLGGNTDIVRKQLEFDDVARSAGISIIPDCGQVPGLGTTLCAYAMRLLDRPREVYMWDGGLPQNPEPPWNYQLTFNIEGLTNEYYGTTVFLRGGELFEIGCFEEYELIDFPEPIGQLEAFTTAGGTSTAPWTYLGKLDVYQNKTIRYPGHYEQWKAFRDAGLFELKPVQVGDIEVVPRQLFHKLIEPQITAPVIKDLAIIRVLARGEKDGQPAEIQLDFVDYYDEVTGFTAMERSTGWHAAIVAEMMARGQTPRGAVPVELGVDPVAFVRQMPRRGLKLSERITVIRTVG